MKQKTADPEFDKRFRVFTSVTDTKLMTPLLIQKMKSFSAKIGKRISVTFLDSSVIIAVYRSRSLFQPYVNKPVIQQKDEILNDIRLLQSAWDIL